MSKEVAITYIFSDVSPAYGERWGETFSMLRNDPLEWERVEALALDMLERGQQEPGRIDYDPEDNHPYLGNGTHRFYASVLLGCPTFLVEYEDDNEDASSDSSVGEFTTVVFDIATKDQDYRNELMDMFTSVMNFRLNDSVWVEVVGVSSTSTGIGICCDVSLWTISSVHYEDLQKAIIDRLKDHMDINLIEYLTINHGFSYNKDLWRQQYQ